MSFAQLSLLFGAVLVGMAILYVVTSIPLALFTCGWSAGLWYGVYLNHNDRS